MTFQNQFKEPMELKDSELLEQTKALVNQERELSAFVLRHLEEVERRRLYAPKYSSIFEYCTLELKYSGSAAQRRISSMRVMKTVPQVEEMITSGTLTLTHVAQAAQFFRIEEKNDHLLTPMEKLSVLESLENKSTREAEKELASRSSNPAALLNQESIRPVTATHSRISFVAEQSLLDELEQVKALLSHRFPQIELPELISQMAKITISHLEAKKFAQVRKPRESIVLPQALKRQTSKSPSEVTKPTEAREFVHVTNLCETKNHLQVTNSAEARELHQIEKHSDAKELHEIAKLRDSKNQPQITKSSDAKEYLQVEKTQETKYLPQGSKSMELVKSNNSDQNTGADSRPRTISAHTKRETYKTLGLQCTFIDPTSGRRCTSRHQIEYEHRTPYALGGDQSEDNITLLCKIHNLWNAEQVFGNKVSQYYRR